LTAEDVFSPGGIGMVAIGVIGLGLVAFAIWRLFLSGGRAPEPEALTDGAVLLASDGIVQQASPDARGLLGNCVGQPLGRLLDSLLGTVGVKAREAVSRLEISGDPIDMLVRSPDGRAFELVGEPAGALVRLVLRDARYVDAKLREAEARVEVAESALRNHSWEQETLHGLVADAPIIAWHRTAEGQVNWSAGQIRARNGAVTPEQTVELIVARTRLNRQPALVGQPQKSRIEIVINDAAETVSLHVIEIVRPDGSRIGFATDAGTAAAAERTLTRFVQTMTETFAHLTVGLAIFDRNQTLALFNPALVQMWQVEPAWLARRPSLRDILDELRAIRRLPELEDFHQWRSRLLGLFENTEAADYEELWHLADGSNIRVLARPHPHGSLAFNFDDVTERMRLEQRYRHSIDLRRATLDGLTEGIAVFGANGLLQFVNQAFHEIWGTDGDTVYAAMHARQLIALCEDIAGETEIWQRLHGFITGDDNRRAWTARLRMSSGRALTARFAALPDGSTMAVFSDISESERISQALIERSGSLAMAETARSALVRLLDPAPAAALGGLGERLDALGRPGALPDEARDLAARVAGASAALGDALGQAMSIISRPLDPRDDRAQNCDVGEVLRFVRTIVAPRAEDAGVALAIDDGGAPQSASCSVGRLRQIAFHLAIDAVARAQPGYRVTLGGDGDADYFTLYAECAPADEGVDPAAADGDGTRTEIMRLVQRLVDAENGRMEVEEDVALGWSRVICRFAARGPRSRNTDARPSGLALPAPGRRDNVHELKTRTG
jgi:PAS domain-containing protein